MHQSQSTVFPCTFTCLLRLDVVVKTLWHTGHWKPFPRCKPSCRFLPRKDIRTWPQKRQGNAIGSPVPLLQVQTERWSVHFITKQFLANVTFSSKSASGCCSRVHCLQSNAMGFHINYRELLPPGLHQFGHK